MTVRVRAIVALSVLFSWCAVVPAQVPAKATRPAQSLSQIADSYGNSSGGSGMAAQQQGPGNTAAKAPPSPRLAALMQATFDRRPSAMLKAWAKGAPEPLPENPPPDAKAEQAKTDEPQPSDGAPPTNEVPPPVTEAPPVDDAHASNPPALEVTDKPAVTESTASPSDAKPPSKPDPLKAAWEQKRIARDIEILQHDVALGHWDKLGAFLAVLPETERLDGYARILTVLPLVPPQPNQNNGLPSNLREQCRFSFDDLLAIWRNAPASPERKHVELLEPIVRRAFAEGHVNEELIAKLREAVAVEAKDARITRRGVAWLLVKLGQEIDLDGFLPTVEEAIAGNDREGLNLLARHAIAVWNLDKKPASLERAWLVTQAALASGSIGDDDKADALRRAVELAPKVRAELGDKWLAESFTSRPERGMEVIATIGSQSSRGFEERMRDPEFRLTGLELQKTAVDALLAAAPERAESWRQSLAILAENWLAEAQHAYAFSNSSARGPIMRRDAYGNIFYLDGGGYQPTPVQPIEPGKLLDIVPAGRWFDLLDSSLKPRFNMVVAQLMLKVNEPDEAFPYIEQLAKTYPKSAKELAAEFMRVWIRNHDPNASNNTNPYMYMYGFDQRSNGIPLTRSQQDRNLEDLAKWVTRLRALPVDALDEAQLVDAFTHAHSTAEVYRLESIESVFGALDKQKPETLADLVQHMRANLASVWRRPSTQEDKKTRRSQKDIEREVLRGYTVAGEVIDKAIAERGEHWKLVLAQASVLHDVNNFAQELAAVPQFAANRTTAMERFAHAADLYAKLAPTLSPDEETTEVYETWFYASLGACDLGAVKAETRPDTRQPELIRRAILALPGESAARHMSRFANLLFNRMAAVNPAVKSRYLEGGFAVVGDHPQAEEARKVFAYYKDLVSELRLVTEVDGPSDVGWKKPFGLKVSLRHTKEIERESGGFGKYLRNQNNQPYGYNYGRPLENYRDKFQEAANQALQEQFEVLSITFNSPDVTSKDSDTEGWRVTPYAYLLLRARGPQVDKVPQIHLDFDFLDTSGYTVMPITSAALPIDASKEGGAERPYEELTINQTLDERRADKGKLSLEIKATARGLVPDLDEILDLAPKEFRVDHVDDQGVSVNAFDDDQVRIASERLWNVTLVPRDDIGHAASRFEFGRPRDPSTKVERHRYADADLVASDEEITLDTTLGKAPFPWWWIAISLGTVALLVGFFAMKRSRQRGPEAARHRVPDRIEPFSVLALLREIAGDPRLPSSLRGELDSVIGEVESYYFSQSDQTGRNAPDLAHIATEWVRRAG